MKEIKSQDYDEYRNEVSVLERFSGSNKGHSHLIRLLMAFKHGERYYLLFRWAEGNLVDLWKKHRLSPTSSSDTRWLIKQSLGMADGLRKINCHSSWDQSGSNGTAHKDRKYRGRHGDIKPENILWFEKDGDTQHHLVISDFGLTRFHSPDSVSRVANRLVGGFSPTYSPPELDLQEELSQKYDIWSLGCLYLEFLSLIETETLVVNCGARSTIDLVHKRLTEIWKCCEASEEYCIPRAGLEPTEHYMDPLHLGLGELKVSSN